VDETDDKRGNLGFVQGIEEYWDREIRDRLEQEGKKSGKQEARNGWGPGIDDHWRRWEQIGRDSLRQGIDDRWKGWTQEAKDNWEQEVRNYRET